MESDEKISSFQIAFMIIGSLVGAGFASGREMWVYFGSFGALGFVGLGVMLILFLLICFAGARLAAHLGTMDFGEVITPEGNKTLAKFVEVYMVLVLWSCIIIMTAAGASVGMQQFGAPKVVGGVLVAVLTLITVFGDFERVRGVLSWVMPVLVIVMMASIAVIIGTDIPSQGYTNPVQHGSLTPTWWISAFIYTFFNVTGSISMSIINGGRTRDMKKTGKGIILAVVSVIIVGVLMCLAVQKDPSFTEAMDMPLLAYSALVSKPINIALALALMIAIYSSACSNFYSFSTAIPDGKYKKLILVIAAAIGYAIGLVGFKNIVDYMFSIFGFIGIAIIAMLFIHYYQVFIKSDRNLDKVIRNND